MTALDGHFLPSDNVWEVELGEEPIGMTPDQVIRLIDAGLIVPRLISHIYDPAPGKENEILAELGLG